MRRRDILRIRSMRAAQWCSVRRSCHRGVISDEGHVGQLRATSLERLTWRIGKGCRLSTLQQYDRKMTASRGRCIIELCRFVYSGVSIRARRASIRARGASIRALRVLSGARRVSIRHFVATRARRWSDSLHPPGSERPTDWSDSLHPGAVSARFVRAMPVSSFLEDWHGVSK